MGEKLGREKGNCIQITLYEGRIHLIKGEKFKKFEKKFKTLYLARCGDSHL